MRYLSAFFIALVAVSGASAHITARPAFGPAGAELRLVLNVINERLTHPMSELTVSVPAGMTVQSAERLGPWRATLDGDRVTWRGGVLGPNFTEDFALVVRMPSRPGAIELQAVQGYPDGGVTEWPVTLTVTPGSSGSDGLGAGGIVVAAIAGLAVVAGSLLALRALRRRSLQER